MQRAGRKAVPAPPLPPPQRRPAWLATPDHHSANRDVTQRLRLPFVVSSCRPSAACCAATWSHVDGQPVVCLLPLLPHQAIKQHLVGGAKSHTWISRWTSAHAPARLVRQAAMRACCLSSHHPCLQPSEATPSLLHAWYLARHPTHRGGACRDEEGGVEPAVQRIVVHVAANDRRDDGAVLDGQVAPAGREREAGAREG